MDRITQSVNEWLGESKTFEGADDLWQSFQLGIKNYVDQNGGSAIAIAGTTNRPNWNDIKDVLEGRKPISSLGCK